MKKTKMLKKNYEFKKVLSKGKYYSGRNIEAFIKDNNKNYVRIFLCFFTKILQTYQQLWITMWISFVRKDEKNGRRQR